MLFLTPNQQYQSTEGKSSKITITNIIIKQQKAAFIVAADI